MSQLENGSELLAGLGGTNANNLFDANVQRLNLNDFDVQEVRFDGFAINNQVRGTSKRHYDRIIKFVEIRVEGAPPTGGLLVVQLIVAGTVLSQQYTIAANGTYAFIAVTHDGNGGGSDPFTDSVSGDPLSGPGVLVLGGVASGALNMANAQTLAVQITTASGASDVIVTVHSRRRIL